MSSNTPKAGREATPTGETQGYLSRLQRTASTLTSQGLNYFNQSREGNPTTDPSGADLSTPKERGGTTGPTAFERFMSLGKTRKDWEVEWPPSHWNEGESEGVVETVQPVESIPVSSDPQENREPSTPPPIQDDKAPDAATLAERIQRLLTTSPPQFPPPQPSSQSPDSSADVPSEEQKKATELGEPSPRPAFEPPPRHPALTSDPKLASFLSSPAVMNGDDKGKSKEGGGRQSVWDALERLKAQIPWTNRSQATVDEGKPSDKKKADITEGKEAVLEDDESGVMVYGPLFPSTDPVAAASDVELAKSELVPVSEHHGIHHHAAESTSETPQVTSKPSIFEAHQDKIDALKNKVEGMWPFAKGGEKEGGQGGTEGEGGQPTVSTTRLHFQPIQEKERKKRVWVPSREKISVQVMWWGYRIYLPPPILATLDTQTLTAAKRAALLTAALKYALDRVPLAIVPAPAQPAMRMCKAFTPYLGYVGGFVAWSWGAVKGFDMGYGVTLSATWLLSVAVVPGTWEPPKEGDEKGGEKQAEEEVEDGKEEKSEGKDIDVVPDPKGEDEKSEKIDVKGKGKAKEGV
ncbi:hypothetical protein BDY19DRAFT_912293 [Irpex rosettiformis]|uniref:Uncharacterized protein n=1 Tax=Irpex rosettiformis TaxID=378272 RepID=A0ACB8UIY8_9APHY|nr:hypothetical protein BDY19DRAFT_912293 [Irpex rosettiformis]